MISGNRADLDKRGVEVKTHRLEILDRHALEFCAGPLA